jgi:hypothetical protein
MTEATLGNLSLSDWLAVAGVAIGALGAAPTVILARDRLGGRRPLRRLLDLGSQRQIRILVTSSATNVSLVGSTDVKKRAIRSLVPSGDLAAVAELSAMLSKAYPKKSFIVVPSSATPTAPEGDHFVVGGPVHNNYAAHLVEGRESTAGNNPELIFDATNRYIKFGHSEYGPNIDLEFTNNIPRVDYGIVMLTRVSRGSEMVRVLLVAGLTTFGTHAAAYFAAHQMVQYLREQRMSKSPNLCVLIRSDFVNGQPYHLEPLGLLPGALLPS